MDVLSMPVLLAPPGICHQESNIGAELDLVVLIESCIHCREQRNTARNTFMKPHLWGNFAIRFVFVTGTPADNKFDKDDENLMAMFYEAASYGDMLVANIEDQSFPHVWKQVFTFRWASAFCAQNALIFLFMDHNYSIVPKNLISFLRDCPKNALPDVNVGLYNFENIALASKAEKFDETSPEVMSSISSNSGGYAYLSGIRIVTDAAIVSAFIAPPSMEQANVRILWRMLGVSIKEVNHFVDSVKNYKKY
ncbi:hypothetical protein FBUS_09227 [Fasciolopsis buskii]|uniref:Hexosyltransferase n=1 Tax=Fasciolopsis buskii TaxID=27845 RepID=A0A8E0S617_9TREM|nr:hypothetical protein FBUS_09227 [Fasciolopsis buski]